jgi:hypothetical protein
MVRREEADALRDSLQAFHTNPYAYSSNKKHHSLQTRPIERIRISGNDCVEKQRRPGQQDIQ